MILSVSIGDVDITYDDDCEDRPTPAQLDGTLTIIRLNAINAPSSTQTQTSTPSTSKLKQPPRAMPDPSAWVCSVCGYEAPIIPMARECEAEHERQQEQRNTQP